MDALWSRQVIESLAKDDVELLEVAMQSSLADTACIVEGGPLGTPFSLGGYGFYAQSQFNTQAAILIESERDTAVGMQFLSNAEWEIVNERLSNLAQHGTPKVHTAIAGDSLISLAIRESAFRVARRLIELGADPLVENEDGLDAYEVLKGQYGVLTVALGKVNEMRAEGSTRVLKPSEINVIDEKESFTLGKLEDQMSFVLEFKETMKQRITSLDSAKVEARRLELKKKEFPPDLVFQLSVREKAQAHYDSSDELHSLLVERVRGHKLHGPSMTDLGGIVRKQADRQKLDYKTIARAPVEGEDDEEATQGRVGLPKADLSGHHKHKGQQRHEQMRDDLVPQKQRGSKHRSALLKKQAEEVAEEERRQKEEEEHTRHLEKIHSANDLRRIEVARRNLQSMNEAEASGSESEYEELETSDGAGFVFVKKEKNKGNNGTLPPINGSMVKSTKHETTVFK
jgi:hypothetical protein